MVLKDMELPQRRSRSLCSQCVSPLASESLFSVLCATGNCCLQLQSEESFALGDFKTVILKQGTL